MGSECKNWNATLIVGVSAVAIGTLFLLGQFGLIDPGKYIRFWPVIMIVIGVSGLLQPVGKGKIVGSGMLTLVGTMLLLIKLNYLNWNQAWPILLIGLGVLMVFESLRPSTYSASSADYDARAQSVFSSVEKNIVAQDFREGIAEAVFGSIEMDFTHAEMAADKAVLKVSAVFGSVEVRTPSHWAIVVEANAVFGSCENKARPPLPTSSPKTLIIRGDAVFGSVEVKN
jgi:predicted membrane protein